MLTHPTAVHCWVWTAGDCVLPQTRQEDKTAGGMVHPSICPPPKQSLYSPQNPIDMSDHNTAHTCMQGCFLLFFFKTKLHTVNIHRVQKNAVHQKRQIFNQFCIKKTASKAFTSLCYTQDRLLDFSLVRAITQPEGLQAKKLLNRFLPESLEWVIDMHRQSS